MYDCFLGQGSRLEKMHPCGKKRLRSEMKKLSGSFFFLESFPFPRSALSTLASRKGKVLSQKKNWPSSFSISEKALPYHLELIFLWLTSLGLTYLYLSLS